MTREVLEETLLILQESQRDPLLELVAAVSRVDVLSSSSPPRVFSRPSAIGKINSPCLRNITSFALSLISFLTPQGLRSVRHPSKFLPRTERIRGTIQVRLSFQIDGFLTDPSK